MQRKILFGGTIVLSNTVITKNAILVENNKILKIAPLKEILSLSPKNTVTDLINLNNKTIYQNSFLKMQNNE